MTSTLRLLAPAKINLGLEVLGRRDDGYHEIRTVLQAISIFDRLAAQPSPEFLLHTPEPDLPVQDNLVTVAAEAFAGHNPASTSVAVVLQKRIPAAAGLGGASSDAAATLLALDRINRGGIPLSSIAAQVGSDVPFFLRGGAALASGRGEVLEPLPSLRFVWGVAVVPDLHIPRKTTTLYAALEPQDRSDGTRVDAVATSLRALRRPPAEALANAFARSLANIVPSIEAVRDAIMATGAQDVFLSGAGPAHFALFDDPAAAHAAACRLRAIDSRWRVHAWRPIGHGVVVHEVTHAAR